MFTERDESLCHLNAKNHSVHLEVGPSVLIPIGSLGLTVISLLKGGRVATEFVEMLVLRGGERVNQEIGNLRNREPFRTSVFMQAEHGSSAYLLRGKRETVSSSQEKRVEPQETLSILEGPKLPPRVN